MTKKEKRLVYVVLHELTMMKYDDLNKIFGSITISEIHDLYNKMKYADFCKARGIKSYKQMTDEDYEEFGFEQARKDGYEA